MTAEKMSTPGGLQRRSQIESGHQTKIGAELAAKLDKPGVVFFFFLPTMQNQAARLSFHHSLSVTLGKFLNLPGYQQPCL